MESNHILHTIEKESEIPEIRAIRKALGSSGTHRTWFTTPATKETFEVLESLETETGFPDILSWAFSLKDERGSLLWVAPKSGVTSGRLSSTFLELAALVRGDRNVRDLLSSRSNTYLISSLTIESKSFSRFYIDTKKDEIKPIITLPLRIDIGNTDQIPFHMPFKISGLKMRGEEALQQSASFLNKKSLREWGLIDNQNEPTARASLLIDALESWLLYEYVKAKGLQELQDLLPVPLAVIYTIESSKSPTREELADILSVDFMDLEISLEPILRRIGIHRWMWKDNKFVSLNSPSGDAIVPISDRKVLWIYLKPGIVYPNQDRIDKWDPAAGVTPEIMDRWLTPAQWPISIIMGKLGSGKTIILGSIAMGWMVAGKPIATLNTGMKVPPQPEDGDLLVIVDDADRLPPNYLYDLLSTWQNPMGARLLLTMRSEMHDIIMGEARRHQQLPGSDHWKTIEVPEWSEDELRQIEAQFTDFFPIAPKLLVRCQKLQYRESIPVVIAAYLKDAWNGIMPPNDAIPPINLQLKFIRLLADMLVDESPNPKWKGKWAEAVFETYCCAHIGRCRIVKDALDELMNHFLGSQLDNVYFPYDLLRYEEEYDMYRVPHWQAPFAVPFSLLIDGQKELSPIGAAALEVYKTTGWASRQEARRLGFLVEEFRKRRKPDYQEKYHTILRDITRKILEKAQPGSQLWLWPIESIHGFPDPKFSCLELYPRGTWTINGVKKWAKNIDDETITNIMTRLITNGEQSLLASRNEASIPLFKVAGLLGIYAPAEAKHLSIQGLCNTAVILHKEGDIEQALAMIEGSIEMARESEIGSISREMLPGLIGDKAIILLEEGQWVEAEAWALDILTMMNPDENDEERRSVISSAWWIIADSLGHQNKLEEALFAIEKAELYLPSSSMITRNLPGRIYSTKSRLFNLKGETEVATEARDRAIEEYQKAGDIESTVRAMRRAEKEAVARFDMEEAQKISNEISRLLADSHGSSMLGEDIEVREMFSRYHRAKIQNNLLELYSALEAIIEYPAVPAVILIDVISEYVSLCGKRGRSTEAIDALKKGVEAAREVNDLLYESIFLQDLGNKFAHQHNREEALKCYVDLFVIYQTIAPYRAYHSYENMAMTMKSLGISRIESFRGVAEFDGDTFKIESKGSLFPSDE